jgi:hypothetical protein
LIRPLVVVACALVACAPRPQTTTATTTSTTSTLVPNEGWEPLAYARDHMEVNFHDVRTVRSYQYITGETKNKGTATVIYWEVAFRFFDANDQVIDTATLNNMLERLGPGDTKQWELMHRPDPRTHHFLYDLVDVRLAPR